METFHLQFLKAAGRDRSSAGPGQSPSHRHLHVSIQTPGVDFKYLQKRDMNRSKQQVMLYPCSEVRTSDAPGWSRCGPTKTAALQDRTMDQIAVSLGMAVAVRASSALGFFRAGWDAGSFGSI